MLLYLDKNYQFRISLNGSEVRSRTNLIGLHPLNPQTQALLFILPVTPTTKKAIDNPPRIINSFLRINTSLFL